MKLNLAGFGKILNLLNTKADHEAKLENVDDKELNEIAKLSTNADLGMMRG